VTPTNGQEAPSEPTVDAGHNHTHGSGEPTADAGHNHTHGSGEPTSTSAPSDTVQPPNLSKAGKALALNLQIVKDPVFKGDLSKEIVLRQVGNSEERGSNFYLALTAESLRDAAINTLGFSIDLGSDFSNIFELNLDKVFFSDAMAVQRHVQFCSTDHGPSLRFEGAGLENLGAGQSIAGPTVLAYIQLQLRDDINQLIKDKRSNDEYGLRNHENFAHALHFDVSANVDSVVFSDQLSLRDVGGTEVLFNPSLDVTVRAADVDMHTHSKFKLGTKRSITKPGEESFSNLIRHGDTINQTTKWRNNSQFSLSDLQITDISNDVADVASRFGNGSANLNQLGWSDIHHNGEVAFINTSFHITGAAGSVLDTTKVGFEINADGDYSWNTTKMAQFAVKNLVTYKGDLTYDGAVDMADLVALNKGAKGDYARDVDADFNGEIDFRDLAVIDAEWGKSLHSGDDKFKGSENISMEDLFNQEGHQWDSSAFATRNAIEHGEHPVADGFVNVLTNDSPHLLGSVQGTDPLNAILEQQQQHALSSV
jgi:hypothetical protein